MKKLYKVTYWQEYPLSTGGNVSQYFLGINLADVVLKVAAFVEEPKTGRGPVSKLECLGDVID